MNLFSLEEKIAFVTGAGSGIGQRISVGLAEAGASVGCFDLASSKGLQGTVDQIKGLGRQAIAATGDVREAADLRQAVDAVENELGALSIAINCAGIANAAPAEEMPLDQWKRMLDINVTGIFVSCQAEAKVMLPRKQGSIVNIASMSGIIVNRGLLQAHYNASKAAVIHLSKSLAMEWAPRGIRVNSISPGYTATPMNTRPEVAEQVKRFEADTPLGRMAAPTEMVGPAVVPLSDAASFFIGAENVGMLTGDASVTSRAPIICCTAEVLANIALREGADADIGQVVMDEFHFYAEPQRGWAWQVPILSLPQAQFLLMSGTLGDM